MKYFQLLFFMLVGFFCFSCGTAKPIQKAPEQPHQIAYKLITNSVFDHLDVSYLDRFEKGVTKKDLIQKVMDIPIGLVSAGYIASISSTGYGAKDSTATLELQIIENGKVVAHQVAMGKSPSVAVSYVVE
ncbi:MAG TPA: hypothetical protein ENK85_12490 [Saprospiraceae bacterium]|nr:hypothetical protein [Saprospiraceae bacterium]